MAGNAPAYRTSLAPGGGAVPAPWGERDRKLCGWWSLDSAPRASSTGRPAWGPLNLQLLSEVRLILARVPLTPQLADFRTGPRQADGPGNCPLSGRTPSESMHWRPLSPRGPVG